MNKTKTKRTIMLIMLTVLAMATLFATDVTNASANKIHHKRTHRVYKKKKAKKRHVAKKPKHKKRARRTTYRKRVAKKKTRKMAYKKPVAKKKSRRVVKKIAKKRVTKKRVTHRRARKSNFSSVYRSAASKLGHPYSLGASGPYVFDCSSFTQYAYRHGAHKYLARTAQMQYNTNRHVSRKHIKKGDLVFFGPNRRSIEHVGIYIGHDRMIDAQLRGVVTEKIHAPWWHEVGYARVA